VHLIPVSAELMFGCIWFMMDDSDMEPGETNNGTKITKQEPDKPKEPELTEEEKREKVKHDHQVARLVSMLRTAVRQGNTKGAESIWGGWWSR